jgi:predicted phosphodiesterase
VKYAVISDLHSNLEALESALQEIGSRKIDHIICLGDVVGYGANPKECLSLIADVANEVVMGNHDQAIEDTGIRANLNPLAREAIEWTAGVLTNQEKKMIRNFKSIVVDKKNDVTWTHGEVFEPRAYTYIFHSSDAAPSFLSLETKVCFFGHTHIPALFSENSDEDRYLPEGLYSLKKGLRYMINPGSVGQPRDHDPKLSFAIFDSNALTIEVIRLQYDNKKTAQKIREAGLPHYFADRLL